MSAVSVRLTEFEMAMLYSEWAASYSRGNLLEYPDFDSILDRIGVHHITADEAVEWLDYNFAKHGVDCISKFMTWLQSEKLKKGPGKKCHTLSYQLYEDYSTDYSSSGVCSGTERSDGVRVRGHDYKSDNGVYEWDDGYFAMISSLYNELWSSEHKTGAMMFAAHEWNNAMKTLGVSTIKESEEIKMDVIAYAAQCKSEVCLRLPQDSLRSANVYIFYRLVASHDKPVEIVDVLDPIEKVRVPAVVDRGISDGVLVGKTKQEWCREFAETLIFESDALGYFGATPATYARVRLEFFYEQYRGMQNKVKVVPDWLPSSYTFTTSHALFGHAVCRKSWENTVNQLGPAIVSIPDRFVDVDEPANRLYVSNDDDEGFVE